MYPPFENSTTRIAIAGPQPFPQWPQLYKFEKPTNTNKQITHFHPKTLQINQNEASPKHGIVELTPTKLYVCTMYEKSAYY